jgi:hypothetical protein
MPAYVGSGYDEVLRCLTPPHGEARKIYRACRAIEDVLAKDK